MQFTDEILEKMYSKKEYNDRYSEYLFRMSKDITLLGESRYLKRSDRIKNCVNIWVWDKYDENKLLDLQKVNRCMDNRFCPNCRKFSLAGAIHNFKPHFKKLLDDGYYPYLLTLTIPNVSGNELRNTIKKMNIAFRKFFQKLSQPIGRSLNGFSKRLMKFDACLKVLEVTYNKKSDTYHPHFHCIIFSNEYEIELFKKDIRGGWSNKKNDFFYNSIMDKHLMKLWKMCYDGIPITIKNFDKMSENWIDLYLVDIKEMDCDGIYEVLKYTFKDADIINYNVFKNLFCALDGQRIRQGHGLLYNIKVEDNAEGEQQSIDEFLEKKENPEKLITREIVELITVYHDYKKISRFSSMKELSEIE